MSSKAHHNRSQKPRERVALNVRCDAVSELKMEADARNVAFGTLCTRLLEIIAEDSSLLENILDGDLAKQEGR